MRIIHMIPLLGVLFLMGCATMDLSMLDTAVPLKAKQVKIMEYQSLANNPFIIERIKADTTGYKLANSNIYPAGTVFGFQFNLGLGHELELGDKVYVSDVSSGGNKVYLKLRLYHNADRVSIAFIPAYGFNVGGDTINKRWEFFSWENPRRNTFSYDYKCHTFEFPLAFSIKHGGDTKDKSTFIVRVSEDHSTFNYHYNQDGISYMHRLPRRDQANLWRAGLYYNMDIILPQEGKGFILGFGVEASPITSKRPLLMPTVALGIKFPTIP